MINSYDPHKKYKKAGECRRCGRCCDLHCPRLKWVAIRDIIAGEQIRTGKDPGDIYAFCEIFDLPIVEGSCTLEQRQGFPTSPPQTPKKCGYYWVEE